MRGWLHVDARVLFEPSRGVSSFRIPVARGSRDVVIEQVGATRIVALGGEYDIGTLGRLEKTLRAAVAAGPVVVDLAECGFIGSSSLAILFHASQSAPVGRFAVVVPPGSKPARRLRLGAGT
jgi:anti-anti-sigma factor